MGLKRTLTPVLNALLFCFHSLVHIERSCSSTLFRNHILDGQILLSKPWWSWCGHLIDQASKTCYISRHLKESCLKHGKKLAQMLPPLVAYEKSNQHTVQGISTALKSRTHIWLFKTRRWKQQFCLLKLPPPPFLPSTLKALIFSMPASSVQCNSVQSTVPPPPPPLCS